MSLRAAKKRVKKLLKKTLTPSFITSGVLGVVEDVKSGKYPDSEKFTHVWNIGDVKELGDFECCREVVEELVAAFNGRTMHHLVMMNEPMLLTDPKFIIELAASTNELDAMMSEYILKHFIKKKPDYKLKADVLDELLEKRRSFLVANGMPVPTS